MSPRVPLVAPRTAGSDDLGRQLDRLYEVVAQEMAAGAGTTEPVWIPPAELVRLIAPYLGRN